MSERVRTAVLIVLVVSLLAACSTATSVTPPTVAPTDTPVPPTETPVPPTETPMPPPTDTPVPPTDTPVPPTETPMPPTTATWTPRATTPTAESENGIVYLPGWELDVRLPERIDGLLPTVLLLHGGGGPDRTWMYPLAEPLIEQGYATVLPDWGATGLFDWTDDFPNAFCSLAWIYANADAYSLDRERVVVLGHSAGGHAAAIIGTVDDPAEFLQGCPYQLPASGWTKGVVTYGGVFGTKELYLTYPREDFGNETMYDLYDGTLELAPGERAEIHDILMDTPYEG
jgi:acetyl esterase/lipase